MRKQIYTINFKTGENNIISVKFAVYLAEIVAKFHKGHSGEHTQGGHHELAASERVHVRLDNEEVRGRLDGKEARAGYVHPTRVLEVLDRCSCGNLKLQNSFSVNRFGVDYDIHVGELILLEHSVNGTQVQPQVVGVEDLELLDGLELFDLLFVSENSLKDNWYLV